MSRLFSSPKRTKIPAQQAEAEPVETVTEDATEAGRRRRRHLVASQTKTRFAGLQSALLAGLKQRLGT